jgi:hypothetical protein
MSFPTTLYKAIRLPNGRNVCVDIDHLLETTKVVADVRERDLAMGQGWTDHPLTAMAQLEAEQEALSTASAVRAHDDRRMSERAKAEAAQADQATGFTFVPEVPEKKKRGRPKKMVGT